MGIGTLFRRKAIWIPGLLALCGLLGWAAMRAWSGTKPAQRAYYRGAKLSKMLLQLSGEGPKGVEALRVPNGFDVEVAAGADLVSYVVFAIVDERGRLFVCESSGRNGTDQEIAADPSFRIRLVEDSNGDGVYDRSKVFADKITMAMGALWHRGSLYVAAPPDVLRFDDTDGDGVADRRAVVLTGWPLKSNATTLHGPFLGPDGWMHLTYSPSPYKIQTKEGTVIEGKGGRVWRFRPDGTRLEWFVGGGFANPVEVAFNPAGETFGTLTYSSPPRNGERDGILHYIDGAVYPQWSERIEELPYKRTGDLMPVMTRFARVAPAGLTYYKGTSLGPEFHGNLLSAHFNPHRILRHVLHREGSTFRTEDEEFLTSVDIDFHPTDVLEDGDGSLLVVDTGGWYLHGCPVSRVSKPQYKGAIYRVRRRGAPRVEDPFGTGLNMDKLSASELAARFADSRPFVRDRALDLLSQRGAEAIEPAKRLRETHRSAEVRASAVFALGRIDHPNARAAVREALKDPNLDARIAAARMAGLNKDVDALPRLMEMVRSEEMAARRQAAEALGRICDTRALPALLAASANPGDRFLEHAIIYAMILLRTPEPLIQSLGDSRPAVRKASLIALDQMDGKPLRREHLVAMLGSPDEELAKAVLWVASRHKEWSADVLGFVRARFEKGADLHIVRRALQTFCSEPDMHTMVVDLLQAPSSPERRIFLLDAMDRCSLEKMPALWIEQLRQLAEGGSLPVRERAIALAGSRRMSELDPQLQKISRNAAEPAGLRTSALSAIVSNHPQLQDADLQFLLGVIGENAEANLRLSAAQVLSRSRLIKDQLLLLATKYLPDSDPLVLPVLLEAYRHAKEEEIGLPMVAALLKSRHPVGGMAADRLVELLKNFPPSVRSAARPLLAQFQKEKDSQLQRLRDLEPLLHAGGDVGRGRQVFFGDKAACGSCHTIGAEGANVGPDLTAVGAVRSGIDILEAIVFPSASFVPGHEVYRITTAREVYTGVVRGGGSSEPVVTLVSGPRDVLRIPRKEIVSMEMSPVSLMPDGFDKSLTRGELVDLLLFLQSQKSRVESGRDLVSELE